VARFFANISALWKKDIEGTGVMAGDRSTSKGNGLPPLTPRPVHKPTPEEVDRRGDEICKKSIADLAQHLSERAKQPPIDLRTEAEKRRAAMLAYELARARRLKLIAGASGAAIAAAGIAWFVVTISMPMPEATASAKTDLPGTQVETASLVPSPSPSAALATPPAPPPQAAPSASTPTPPSPPPVTRATASPPPAPEPPPSTAASAPAAPAPAPAAQATPPAPPPAQRAAPQAATSSTSTPPSPPTATAPPPSSPPPAAGPPSASTAASAPTPAPTSPPPGTPQSDAPQPAGADAPAAPNDTPLQRAEIREVQTKLYTFGFNPGPIDGADGPMTHAAIMHYEADRGLPKTGEVDRTLLETLRQDPAPQVVAAPPPPPRRMSHGYARRSDDPFASLRAAGDRLGRWLQSLSR
jgi:hypothetical protein